MVTVEMGLETGVQRKSVNLGRHMFRCR